jgi:RNA polymerase sigma-70 factor, ECF subfamily
VLHDDSNEKIDRFTRGIVRRKVKQLIGRAGFTKQDRKDLEHDFYVRVLQGMRSFDSDIAHRNKFVTAIVERYVANILRDKQAEKRDYRRVNTLHVMVDIGEGEEVELAQMISQCDLNAQRHRYPRSEEELSRLAQDLAEVMAKLPNELHDLAERLKTQTQVEIARAMGIPRTSLSKLVRQLRQRFEDAGLKDYL